MTKVQLPFALAAPLDEATMNQLPAVYEIYGILRINIEPGGKKANRGVRCHPIDSQGCRSRPGEGRRSLGKDHLKHRTGTTGKLYAFALGFRPAGSRHFCLDACNLIAAAK